MKYVTLTRNVLCLLYTRSCWIDTCNIEKIQKKPHLSDNIDTEDFLSDLKDNGNLFDFRYENKGKGNIIIYGNSDELDYKYKIEILIKEPLRNYYNVTTTLSYAIISKDKNRSCCYYRKKGNSLINCCF